MFIVLRSRKHYQILDKSILTMFTNTTKYYVEIYIEEILL